MLRVAGLFLLALGVIWVLQGTGLLDWPRGSFMLGRQDWAVNGALAMLVGAAMLWWAARRRRR